ncbi:MAG: DUF378 domain-containing protein, partial [Alphaproteobacteria bacterium]|nr:DUF378 domain-containing protein [Alphaproteobacteria bacterium]
MRGLKSYVLMPLTFIGALNWGLVGIFGFDLVAFFFFQADICKPKLRKTRIHRPLS